MFTSFKHNVQRRQGTKNFLIADVAVSGEAMPRQKRPRVRTVPRRATHNNEEIRQISGLGPPKPADAQAIHTHTHTQTELRYSVWCKSMQSCIPLHPLHEVQLLVHASKGLEIAQQTAN